MLSLPSLSSSPLHLPKVLLVLTLLYKPRQQHSLSASLPPRILSSYSSRLSTPALLQPLRNSIFLFLTFFPLSLTPPPTLLLFSHSSYFTTLSESSRLSPEELTEHSPLISRMALCSWGQVSPVCALIGGVLGQEILKAVSGGCTGQIFVVWCQCRAG